MNIDLLRTGRVCSIFHVIKSPLSITNWCWSFLGWLEKLGLSNNFSFWLLNTFRTQFLSIRDAIRSFVEVEVTWIFFRRRLFQFSVSQLLEYNQLVVFLEGWLHSIEFDRMSILSQSQDRCRSNIQRLDVFSMHYAGIVHDVVIFKSIFKDPCDFCPEDQQAGRILSVSCLNSDLQIIIQSWW